MNWPQFAYQYIIGGIIFFVGLLIPILTGGWKFKSAKDTKLLIILLVGLVYYALGHGIWIYLAGR